MNVGDLAQASRELVHCANSQTCPIKDAPAGHREGGVWCKQLQPPLGALWCSLKSDKLVGKGKMMSSQLLLPRDGSLACCYSGSPQQKSEQPPLLCPRLPSDPCPQPAVGMPDAIVFLCFISGWWLVFQTPHLKGPSKVQTCFPPQEDDSPPALHIAPFCPRKIYHTPSTTVLLFYLWHRAGIQTSKS